MKFSVCVPKMDIPRSHGFTDLIMTAPASHRVFTTKSPPSTELNNLLCATPTAWHYRSFPGPRGEQ